MIPAALSLSFFLSLALSAFSFPASILAELPPDDPSQLGHGDPIPSPCPDNAAVLQELGRTETKLHFLERSLSEKDVEFQDKIKLVASLQHELEELKRKEGSDRDALQEELGSKITRLENKLKKMGIELQKYKEKAKDLEANSASQSLKINQLEKLVAEQKNKISMLEKLRQLAELTLAKAQKETAAKNNELLNVQGGWLPPWILVKLSELQDSAVAYWKKYVHPIVDATAKKGSEKASTVWKALKSYADNLVEHARVKWRPVINHHLESVTSTLSPHIQNAKSKLAEGYESAAEIVSPYLEKVHEAVKPHLEIVKEVSRPYYKQVESKTKPYRKKIFKQYKQLIKSTRAYHVQIQRSVESMLKKVDILKPMANKEIVWFLASAILSLPALLLSLLFSSILGSPKKKPVKTTVHGNRAHRKPKRVKHADK